jgi:CYTH domain-containing protein
MPQEIEHKYLVRLEDWKPATAGVLYRQGYLSSVKERVVRVRIAEEQAYLTIKGLMRSQQGLQRRTLLAERHARHLAGRAQTLQDARKPMHTDPSTI